MVADRRAWDPFAPPPPPTEPEPQQPGEQSEAGEELPSGLDYMKRADLVALAEQRNLDTTGTRPELIARLREHAEN